ncbi:hypothetical protein MMC25_005630 [Agyrium rufum]|nr:hypothetical protein [Agyrium rufum]
MAVVSPPFPSLEVDALSLYYVEDALLANSPVFIFHGSSTTTNSTLNSSRIQSHVYSIAGFQSFARLTIAPTSPLYAAVRYLQEDKQGDEVCRGLAVSLFKYFAEMPKQVKASLIESASIGRSHAPPPFMFDEQHAGELASKMVKLDNAQKIYDDLEAALTEKSLSWTDVDVHLPVDSMRRRAGSEDFAGLDDTAIDYGKFTDLVKILGVPTFLPTSKLRRAPSKPTAVSKTRVLARDQKEGLRREMCELLDTEERYVGKIYDLVHEMAPKFGRQPRQKSPPLPTAESEVPSHKLFPDSLDRILRVNKGFLKSILEILEQTEDEAINDIQSSSSQNEIGIPRLRTRPRDPTGTEAFARALVQWFPRFQDAYQDYMRASVNFPTIISQSIKNDAAFASAVQEVGEQRLRSCMIEPIQRLPRYSLFIDNMINLLPATHAAMGRFLRARDKITDICALDNDTQDGATCAATKLKDLVSAWPASLLLRGRLVTAIDVVQLDPPFRPSSQLDLTTNCIILLFPASLVVLKKLNATSLSARGVLAEVDKPQDRLGNVTIESVSTNRESKGLRFEFAFDLCDVRMSEMHNGASIMMACNQKSNANPQDISRATGRRYHCVTKAYELKGTYENKAVRLSEEIARARIETRFSDEMRCSEKWCLRTSSPAGDLGLVFSVFEAGMVDEKGVPFGHVSSRSRIFVDDKPPESESLQSKGSIHIEVLSSKQYRLKSTSPTGAALVLDLQSQEVVKNISHWITKIVQMEYRPLQPGSGQAYLSLHETVARALPVPKTQEPAQGHSSTRRLRPLSPVKAFSTFLGGSVKETSPTKANVQALFSRNTPLLPPLELTQYHNDSAPLGVRATSQNPVTLIKGVAVRGKDSVEQLEATFSAYIIALTSRRGNVVGRVLRSRVNAEELAINELYNTLLEDSTRIQAPAEAPIDVLFAAFEKFLKVAWTEKLGSIVSTNFLRSMQGVLDLPRTPQTDDQFAAMLYELTPQNRRAFLHVVRLLSELLDAAGNDGDRGALIATFSEILVLDGNPHDYISLLDRLVDDQDSLVDPAILGAESPTSSLKRTRSVNTGSLSSNASSIRKRFGFGNLSRENSKTDNESRSGSVWRSWGKNSRTNGDPPSQQPSLSKSFLARSRSTDIDLRSGLSPRPSSSDRPLSSSSSQAFTREGSPQRPGSAHNALSTLTTIGEIVPDRTIQTPRKKRRSSLSDLEPLRSPPPVYRGTAAEMRGLPRPASTLTQSGQQAKSSLRPPSPVKLTRISIQPEKENGTAQAKLEELPMSNLPQTSSPSKLSTFPIPHSLSTRNHKENTPPVMSRPTLTERAVNRKSDEVLITDHNPQKRKETQQQNVTSSSLRQPKPHERQSISSNIPSPKKSTTPSPQKAVTPFPQKANHSSSQKSKLQSPQKLHSRIQTEKIALQSAQASLTSRFQSLSADVDKIASPTTPSPTRSSRPQSSSSTSVLTTRISNLESHVSTTFSNLSSRLMTLESDVQTSLSTIERKNKSLDQLYREANSENEALYERFNEELVKVLGLVRKGEGVEELKRRWIGAEEELAKVRAEVKILRGEAARSRPGSGA